uniref:Protein phosphatase inhibitor 2 n=1 Tax=Meloidogyne javanica TaxID=6303 RepID=A0A915MXJ0_MELJA
MTSSKSANGANSADNCEDLMDDGEEEECPQTSLNPTEFLKMKPKKSILKINNKQTSIDDLTQPMEEQVVGEHRERIQSDESQKARFDEIDEPKTPYNAGYSDSEGEELSSGGGTGRPRRVSLAGAVDADELRKCISEGAGTKPKVLDPPGSGEDEDDDDAVLTEEQLAHKREFDKKRRQHYNEGMFLRKMKESQQPDDEDD